jgi:hypothetical protein
LSSQSDGIKSEDDAGLGEVGDIEITGGEIGIAAVNDAIQAAANLSLANVTLKIKTGGGSAAATTADSAKGLKATLGLFVESGSFDIDSNDDALHSNGAVIVSGGTFTISSGDDGVHADAALTINGGSFNISKSYEGLEAENINLNGGSVRVKSSDDGINISGGSDSSGVNRPGGMRPGQQGGGAGGTSASGGVLTVTGGTFCVDASGDGLDSNGSITMSGGTVLVFGPVSNGDAAIDYDGTFKLTGGTLIALGSSGMSQQPGSTSTQYTFLATLTSAVAQGGIINVRSAAGAEIVTVKALKATKSIVVSSPLLAKGAYQIWAGGSYSQSADDYGLYTGGVYSGGKSVKSLTISNAVTSA